MDALGWVVFGLLVGWVVWPVVLRRVAPSGDVAQAGKELYALATSNHAEMLRVHTLTARAMGEIAVEAVGIADELAAALVSHGVLPLDDVVGIRRRAAERMAAAEARMREIVRAVGEQKEAAR